MNGSTLEPVDWADCSTKDGPDDSGAASDGL